MLPTLLSAARGLDIRILALALIIPALPTLSQAFDENSIRLTQADFSTELTQLTVSNFYQDHNGYLWLATQSGLNLYDGLAITQFRNSRNEVGGLPSNWITDLCSIDRQKLWITTFGGGLAVFDYDSHTFSSWQNQNAQDQELNKYTNTVQCINKFNIIAVGSNDGLILIDAKTDKLIDTKRINQSLEITSLWFVEETAQLYIGTNGQGVKSIDLAATTKTITSYDGLPDSASVSSIAALHDQIVVTTLNDGIFVTGDDTSFKQLPSSHWSLLSDTPIAINDMLIVGDSIWLTTNQGLVLTDIQTGIKAHFDQFNSILTSDQIQSIYKDKSGITWLGGLNGVIKITPVFFSNLQFSGPQSSNSVNTFEEWGDRIWVGSDGGVRLIDYTGNIYLEYNTQSPTKLPSNNVMSLAFREPYLWVGTRDAGLARIDIRGNTSLNFSEESEAGQTIPANGITSIRESNDGRLWVASYGGGLTIIDDPWGAPSVITKTYEDTIPEERMILDLEFDNLGDLWAATLSNGLIRISTDESTYEILNTSNSSIRTNTPWILTKSDEGDLWIGSPDAGLSVIPEQALKDKSRNVVSPAELEKLDNRNIFAIEFTERGELWISHNKGLTKFSKDLTSFQEYDTLHGLKNADFNHNASVSLPGIGLLFGGNSGVTVVDEERIFEKPYVPEISFKRIDVHGYEANTRTRFFPRGTVNLSPTERSFTVEVALLDYLDPSKNKFKYRLTGFDEQWTESPSGRTALASYSNLDAGKYTLEVESINEGYFNRGISRNTLEFSIAAPFWQTQTAYILYFVAFLVAISMIVLRMRHVRYMSEVRQAELEDRVAARTSELLLAREEAEKANRSKSEFLATISHELRTPLHGILGLTEALSRKLQNGEELLLTNRVLTSGNALMSLINQILNFAKIEANQQQLEKEKFSFLDLLEEITDLFSQVFEDKKVKFYVILRTQVPEYVESDRLKIKQCIINLVGNALKFTPSGEVCIDVSFHTAQLLVSVRDTGIGIPDKDIDKIFRPFQQLESSASRSYAGTGLGLSIVSSYVELLSGKVAVSSRLNQGTTIELAIPINPIGSVAAPLGQYLVSVELKDERLTDRLLINLRSLGAQVLSKSNLVEGVSDQYFILTDADPRAPSIDRHGDSKNIYLVSAKNGFYGEPKRTIFDTIITPRDLTSLIQRESNTTGELLLRKEYQSYIKSSFKLLIVDDVETNRFLLKMQLSDYFEQISEASNGVEALAQFERCRPDVILMDCQMPVMDGFESTVKIRELEKDESAGTNVVIIALTASALEEDQRKCFECGMNETLTKPFNMQSLINILDALGMLISATHQVTNSQIDANIEQAAVDMQTLTQVKKVSGESFRAIINMFKAETQKSIEMLSTSDNKEAVAHKIKSAALSIGATRVAELAKSFESNVESISRESAIKMLEYLDEFVERSEEIK
ncbi:MAG: ATP-binding protein [Aequoribacter sp.]|uniref:ATP-binding protein n=1 Tax=Aequoribacter sp. TaxID=2847771 RepID=UPI003C398901